MNFLLLVLALVAEILYTLGVSLGHHASMLGLGLVFLIASFLVGAAPAWPGRRV